MSMRALSVLLLAAVALVLTAGESLAATKTVMFGWEDGTSTSNFEIDGDADNNDLPPLALMPDTGLITLANVTTGSMVDYGPSGDPFLEPVTHPVTPFAGARMLEVTLSNLVADGGTDAVVYMGFVTGLDPGDTYEMSFRAFDPTDGRSPSPFPNATYSTVAAPTTFNGFAVPLQTFILGSGWLSMPLDADGNANTNVDPTITYSPTGMVNALRLEADFLYQSLTAANGGAEKFYLDDLVISVTSDNPNARIHLPDGTSVLVNEPAGVLGDYNENGTVDAADYTVWQDRFGETVALPNEGASPNVVDAADYDLWKMNFGNTGAGAGGGLGATAVPEPASLLLSLASLLGLGMMTRSGRRK